MEMSAASQGNGRFAGKYLGRNVNPSLSLPTQAPETEVHQARECQGYVLMLKGS